MPSSSQPLRLEQSDLFSPQVEDYLRERDALRHGVVDVSPQPLLIRVIYSTYFYLSIAGALGALTAWGIVEPFFDDDRIGDDQFHLAHALLFPTVAGFIALFLGTVEGLMCRNLQRALLCAVVGLGVGFGGGLISLLVAGIIFLVMAAIAVQFWQNPQPGQMPKGIALLIFMMGRAAAWAVAAIPAGMGQGIALREKKVILNGLLGGVLGGLLGGLLFDPIQLLFATPGGSAALSRAVGFAVIGVLVGLFVGLVEQWTKSAWLLMRAGALAGKQFVLYRNPTVLGSSPKADVYLFKDDAIEPRHALLHNRGGRFEIEDCNTPDGTYVNGIPIQKHILQTGDQIVLGKTVLEFSLKETK
jgi:FHA domain